MLADEQTQREQQEQRLQLQVPAQHKTHVAITAQYYKLLQQNELTEEDYLTVRVVFEQQRSLIK